MASLNRILVRVAILIVITTTIWLIFVTLASSTGLCDREISTPLFIDEPSVWENESIVVGAEIRILDGGVMDLRSCTIEFDGAYPLQVGIIVEPGGTLSVGGRGMGCILRRGPGNESYFLRAYQESNVSMAYSKITGLGEFPESLSLWKAGNCIRCDNPRLLNCEFQDCYIGVGLEGISGGYVRNCTFLNCSRGIWMTACIGCTIEDSYFKDCSVGVRGFHYRPWGRMSCTVLRCNFSKCFNGVSFDGDKLAVTGSTFWGHKLFQGSYQSTAIFISATNEVIIQETTVQDFQIGLRLAGVGNCELRDSTFQEGQMGIKSSASRLHMIGGSIADVEIAYYGEGSQLTFERVRLNASESGVVLTTGRYSFLLPNAAWFRNVEFVDPNEALNVTMAVSVNIDRCHFTGKETIALFDKVDSLTITGDVFSSDTTTINCTSCGNVTLQNDTLEGEKFTMNLVNSHMRILTSCEMPNPTELRMDGGTTVMSFLPPTMFELVFHDGGSHFQWVKDLSIRVVLASNGRPAIGCDLSLNDVRGVLIREGTIGYSGERMFGSIAIVDVNESGTVELTPHDVLCMLDAISQMETIDLGEANGPEARVIIYLDDLPPNIIVVEPRDEGIYFNSSLIVTGSASDPLGEVENVSISLDGSLVHWVGSSWQATVPASLGWHRLVVHASDNHGNVAETFVWFQVVEPLGPIEVESPSNGTITNSSLLTVSGKAPKADWLTVNSVQVLLGSQGDFSGEVSLAEGLNLLVLRYGTDFEERFLTLHVVRDSVPPGIFLEDLPDAVNASRFEVRGSVLDEHPPQETWIGGRGVKLKEDGTFALELELHDGVHQITIWAEDLAGNGQMEKMDIRIDTCVTLALVGTIPPSTSEESVFLTLSSEKGANLEVQVNDGDFEHYTFASDVINVRIDLPIIGKNEISLLVEDEVGNTESLDLSILRTQGEHAVRDGSWRFLTIIILIIYLIVMALVLNFKRIKKK